MKTLIALLIVIVMSTSAFAALPAVALLGSSNFATSIPDVQSKLMGTGLFSSVTVFDIDLVTPTLAQLRGFSAVLVYTDAPCCANNVTLGNVLADYVDGGGGVVMAVFAVASLPVAGRFATADYWALEPLAQAAPGGLTLGTIHVPGSPLLAGVTSFNGGASSYLGTGNLNAAAIDIADWSNGRPLIATRTINGTPRVDLNFFPPSSDARNDLWVASTNGARIMANALLFVASPPKQDTPFQVSYAANPANGESYINIVNDGASGAALLGPGFGAQEGNICVNVYAFAPDEQEISCCSCFLTPNSVANLGVTRDLTSKTLTGVIPTSVVIKLVSTLAGGDGKGTNCKNSAAIEGTLAIGLVAYGTTPQPAGATYSAVEHQFVPSTLSADEYASIAGRCASMLGNGTGFGVCGSCATGALGANKQ